MCIICVSKKGIKQPSEATLRTMFKNNADGAGYMFARNGHVTISKGFMNADSFIKSVQLEDFTAEDVVVYHCRITTQAGVSPELTHPYPLTKDLEQMFKLDLIHVPCGVAHNGVIPMTTNRKETKYNDTQLFIAKYLTKILRASKDLKDEAIKEIIEELTGHSRMAILDGKENLMMTGDWIEGKDGNWYSNYSFQSRPYKYTHFKLDDELFV